MSEFNRVIQGDCLEVLKTLPDESVNCCVTSPPYYGLRDYGTGKWIGGDPNCPHRRVTNYSEKTITGHAQKELAGNVGDAIYRKICPLCGAVREDKQIGLEETPEEYVEKLTRVFHEVKRVLKDDGTLWLNIGDSYASNSNGGDYGSDKQKSNKGSYSVHRHLNKTQNCKPKDLIGVPWLLAFSLRSDGWFLRQDIIWHKPNPMPESVSDRCTKSHEYIFLMSKKPHYYFDNEAIKEECVETSKDRYKYIFNSGKQQEKFRPNGATNTEGFKNYNGMRNKRDVWTIPVKAVSEAHFATFPEKLIEPCILAGCPPGGVVLDPFFGSGTTGRVAIRLNRQYLGIELNPEYIEISDKRTDNIQLQMLFNE